jgi:hypothetical protein
MLDTDVQGNVNIKGPIAYDGSKFAGLGQTAGEDGYIWDMVVNTSLAVENILSWISEPLPSGFHIRIMNISHREIIESEGYQLRSDNKTILSNSEHGLV